MSFDVRPGILRNVMHLMQDNVRQRNAAIYYIIISCNMM